MPPEASIPEFWTERSYCIWQILRYLWLRFTRFPSCAVSQDGQEFLSPVLAQAGHWHELEVQRGLMLLHAQCPLGMHRMAGLATEIWDKNADVLSVTASKNWVDLHDPHSRKESLSEFWNSSSWALVKPEKMGRPFWKGCECKGSSTCTAVKHHVQLLQCLTGQMGSLFSLPRYQMTNLPRVETHGVAMPSWVGPTFAMLVGGLVKASRDANHLNRHCYTTNKQLHRATKSLLLLYLNGLMQYLASAALTDGTAAEMLCEADMLLQALGQSVASMVQACYHVWLSQSNLSVQAAFEQTLRTRESPCYVSGVPASHLHWNHGSFPASSTASRISLPGILVREDCPGISLLPNSAFQHKVLPQSFTVWPLDLEVFHPPPNDSERWLGCT